MQSTWQKVATHVQEGDIAPAIPHGASIGALLGVLMGWLPVIVALIPAVYYLLLIYESKTVQKWVRRRRWKRAAKRRHKRAHRSH